MENKKGGQERKKEKGKRQRCENRRKRIEARGGGGSMLVVVNLCVWQWREERAMSRFMAACWGNKRMDWILFNRPLHSVVVPAAHIRATLPPLLLYDDLYTL